jgi:hypothetical protein
MSNTPERKYHIVYKTTCLVNNKEYVGVHSTNDLGDGYLGSGHVLKQAISKFGRNNFLRQTLSTHSSREEALLEEKRIVNIDFVSQKTNYNVAIGGEANAGWTVWQGPYAERARKLCSEASRGYGNPDFVKRWLGVYERIAPMVCYYSCCTNLPDRFISGLVNKRLGMSVKLHRALAYYQFKGYIEVSGFSQYMDYFSKDPAGRVQAAKSKVSAKIESIPNSYTEYKALKGVFVPDIPEMLEYLLDDTLSDSMIQNCHPLVPSFGNGVLARLAYLKYLGILTEVGNKRISVRTRLPDSQRGTGKKTLYSYNPIVFERMIDTNGDFNEYTATFDGRTFQATRVPDPEYGNWKDD